MTRAGTPLRPHPALALGPLVAAAVLSWVVVAVWMRGMPAGPGADLGPLGAFAVAWVVMMAAMMLPSVWPTVLVYRRLQAGRRERGDPAVPAGPALLLVGYLAAWTVAGVVGFAVVEAGRTLDIAMRCAGTGADRFWSAGYSSRRRSTS